MSAGSDGVRSGLELCWVDPATRPQDDLYVHVNGRWLATAQIPVDRAQHGMLRALRDQAESDVRTILEEASDPGGDGGDDAGPDERRIGDLYTSFLDTDTIEAVGTDPVRPLIDQITAAPDRMALAELLGRRQREGLVGLFWASVATYVRDSTRSLVHLSQGGLGLPDESYYAEGADAELRQRYLEHLERLAELTGLPDPNKLAASAFDLETVLASAWSDQLSVRDLEKSNNLMTWTELREHAPGFDWTAWLAGLGTQESVVEQVVVGQPGFLAEVGRLWDSHPLQQWKAWMTMRIVSASAPYLSHDLAEATFDFNGRILSGIPQRPERWKLAVALVESALGDAVGQRYVARHFPASAKSHTLDVLSREVGYAAGGWFACR